ncbi:MAG: hypothetical protein KDK65_00535, partial [Chlamydiia bacterium]|nr:hypothetical protein [Chlamydiia bacterium]
EAATRAVSGGVTLFFGAERGELSPRYYLQANHLTHLPILVREIAGIHCAIDALPADRETLFSLAAQHNALLALHRPQDAPADPATLERLIALAKTYETTLYFFPIKSLEELTLIQQAREEHHLIYAELNPLSLGEEWWDLLHAGAIDSVGDHEAPESTLPHLLKSPLPLEKIVELTSLNVQRIFNIEAPQDVVLIDDKGPVHTICRGTIYTS